MKTVISLCVGMVAGVAFIAGNIVGEYNAIDREFHAECFEMEWQEDGMLGEKVDCKRGYPIDGEGVFLEKDTLLQFDAAIEEGDVAKVYWTNMQAANGDWETPAKIELNGRGLK